MMHVALWSSIHLPWVSERTRFILRHGVVPWGMLVGGTATAVLFTMSPPVQRGARPPELVLGFLAFVCFAEWSMLAGWIIGAVLWTLRPRTDETQRPVTSKRAAGEDRGR